MLQEDTTKPPVLPVFNLGKMTIRVWKGYRTDAVGAVPHNPPRSLSEWCRSMTGCNGARAAWGRLLMRYSSVAA